jgi:hypothetical protein
VGWQPQLVGQLDEAARLAQKVQAGAGAGRLGMASSAIKAP